MGEKIIHIGEEWDKEGIKITPEEKEMDQGDPYMRLIEEALGFQRKSNTPFLGGMSLSKAAVFVSAMYNVEICTHNFCDFSEDLNRAEEAAKNIGEPVLTAYKNRLARFYEFALSELQSRTKEGFGNETVKYVEKHLAWLDRFAVRAGKAPLDAEKKKAILMDALTSDARDSYVTVLCTAGGGWAEEAAKAYEILRQLKAAKTRVNSVSLGTPFEVDADNIVRQQDLILFENYIRETAAAKKINDDARNYAFDTGILPSAELEEPKDVEKRYSKAIQAAIERLTPKGSGEERRATESAGGGGDEPPARTPAPVLSVGEQAPMFGPMKLHNPQEAGMTSFTLSRYVGEEPDGDTKGVLISFFATWCGSCKKELLVLVQLSEKYKSRGLQVVSIAIDKDEEAFPAIRDLVTKNHITFPIVMDRFNMLARRYFGEQTSLPSIFLVRRDGTIVLMEQRYNEDVSAILTSSVEKLVGK
ncbi:MAG: TlpA family protein disulfide reductase [Deltaproteobacteria bacterium]|nr:TlpA family protein disulfide reductase [Deltaproteobacteria bacterium]